MLSSLDSSNSRRKYGFSLIPIYPRPIKILSLHRTEQPRLGNKPKQEKEGRGVLSTTIPRPCRSSGEEMKGLFSLETGGTHADDLLRFGVTDSGAEVATGGASKRVFTWTRRPSRTVRSPGRTVGVEAVTGIGRVLGGEKAIGGAGSSRRYLAQTPTGNGGRS
ncbi:hypothetical protein GUJ93_ZPchr0010g9985 [Zizania palustris]|uniref:Uncharacterized protein n=1 Tax=Zizania palustris TaxID=103762 RepID=A0A8J5W7M1_ZIZPA|nr:hypothetical protein GUJ93_ZPchr0010g9985 [Zizania palustris]